MARELECALVWQSPGNGIRYNPGEDFSVGWKIRNTGTVAWNTSSVEFAYLGGAKLHTEALVPLKANAAPGQTLILSVAMRAPENPTMYTTYWGLRRGGNTFCRVSLSIYVK